MKTLREGEPCQHTGCLNHVTHPCEHCGRIAGRTVHPIPAAPYSGVSLTQANCYENGFQFKDGRFV